MEGTAPGAPRDRAIPQSLNHHLEDVFDDADHLSSREFPREHLWHGIAALDW
jgi:hypothetical protein